MTDWWSGNTNAVYSYDANGNRTNKMVTTTEYTEHTETTTYGYDKDNRLVGVSVINAGGIKNHSFGAGAGGAGVRPIILVPNEKEAGQQASKVLAARGTGYPFFKIGISPSLQSGHENHPRTRIHRKLEEC